MKLWDFGPQHLWPIIYKPKHHHHRPLLPVNSPRPENLQIRGCGVFFPCKACALLKQCLEKGMLPLMEEILHQLIIHK